MYLIKQFAVFCILLFCFLLLTGCPDHNARNNEIQPVSNAPITNTIFDATGVTLTLTTNYSRIISLAPSITENIKILKSVDKLVGRTEFCKVPADIPNIGNVLEPSLEKIVSLKPDLVLATKEGNKPPAIMRLREMQVPVFVFGENNSWNSIRSDFLLLGRILQKKDESEAIIRDIDNELAQLSANKSGNVNEPAINGGPVLPKVFVQLNIQPLMTAGRNTFINDIINFSQGQNIAADSILPWPILNVEEIIRKNPDVIIICDMDGITVQAQQMWTEEKFANIDAVKNHKVYVMNADLLCQPTPVNFINAVRKLKEYFK